MSRSGSIPLAALNAVQIAVVAAIVCVTVALPETFFRNGADTRSATAFVAARALAASIDRAMDEIDRTGRLLGPVLESRSDLPGAAKTALLRDWLALQPGALDAALVNPAGIVIRTGAETPDVSWLPREGAGETRVEADAGSPGQFLVAVPLATQGEAERLVLRIGPDWLASLKAGVLRGFALDGARLKFSVKSNADAALAGDTFSRGGERWATGSASTQGSRGLVNAGWTVTAHHAEAAGMSGGLARYGWAAALVLIAALCGYGLAEILARRLRATARESERDEPAPAALRIAEFESLREVCRTRVRSLERAHEEALSDLGRIRSRLGTFEALSGWTCWEIDTLTQRVVWSDLSEGGRATFTGDHAVEVADLIEGIEPADRPLMQLTMRTALGQDGAHDVCLRTCVPGQDGRERRLLIRFRRNADETSGAALRLFALSRELTDAPAGSIGDPDSGSFAEPPPPTERRRNHVLRSVTDGIVHDINDVLTVIGANLALLQRRDLGERESRFLRNAVIGTERGAALSRRLVSLARGGAEDRARTDLAACLAAFLPFVQAKVLGDLPVMNCVPEGLPKVRCGEGILEALVLNLAFHFRDNGFDGLALAATLEQPEGQSGFVRFLVTSGRASDGTSTDKARLAAAAGLLERANGRLRVVDDGQGSEPFLAEAWIPAETLQPASRVRRATSRNLRILLVEADSLVRSSMADLLADLGHHVTQSVSVAHALQRLTHAGDLDAIIASHALPAMNGLQLAATVSERHPGISVIVAGPHGHLPASADRFPRLDKPFRLDDLVAVLGSIDLQIARAA